MTSAFVSKEAWKKSPTYAGLGFHGHSPDSTFDSTKTRDIKKEFEKSKEQKIDSKNDSKTFSKTDSKKRKATSP